jgi:hypothetical protein
MPDFDWRLGVRMLGYGALLAFGTVGLSGSYGWWTDWLQAPLVAVVLGDILWQLSGIMRRRRPTRAEVECQEPEQRDLLGELRRWDKDGRP